MKSFAILAVLASAHVACASAQAVPVAPTPQESVASNDAWHPQEDGFELPEAPQAKRREETPLGSLAPTKHTPVSGQLVNIATKK
jgi:hypothetical protein